MSEQHEVTVYDRVPATAAISREQICAYMLRTGWKLRWTDPSDGYSSFGWDHGTHGTLTTSKARRHWPEDIENIAEAGEEAALRRPRRHCQGGCMTEPTTAAERREMREAAEVARIRRDVHADDPSAGLLRVDHARLLALLHERDELEAENERLRAEQAADRAAVRALVEALPKCAVCGRPATQTSEPYDFACDDHGACNWLDIGHATPLRALQPRMATWGEAALMGAPAEEQAAQPVAHVALGLTETVLYAHHKDVATIRQALEAGADVSATIDWPAFWQRRARLGQVAEAIEEPVRATVEWMRQERDAGFVAAMADPSPETLAGFRELVEVDRQHGLKRAPAEHPPPCTESLKPGERLPVEPSDVVREAIRRVATTWRQRASAATHAARDTGSTQSAGAAGAFDRAALDLCRAFGVPFPARPRTCAEPGCQVCLGSTEEPPSAPPVPPEPDGDEETAYDVGAERSGR